MVHALSASARAPPAVKAAKIRRMNNPLLHLLAMRHGMVQEALKG
jgi:hypothetical protein